MKLRDNIQIVAAIYFKNTKSISSVMENFDFGTRVNTIIKYVAKALAANAKKKI